MRRAVGSNHIQYYPNAQLSRLPLSPSSITLHSYSTPSETRTRTGIAAQGILSPSCLPFHHQSVICLDTLVRFELTSPGFQGFTNLSYKVRLLRIVFSIYQVPRGAILSFGCTYLAFGNRNLLFPYLDIRVFMIWTMPDIWRNVR